MKMSSVVISIVVGLLVMAGCGGGGGGGGTPGTVVSGVASKGIIRNGSIKVYALNADGSKGALLKETTTDGNGAYHADLGTYQGAVLVEASGSYIDEATGALNTVPADAPLRAALDKVTGEASVAVTPLTELAVQNSENSVTHRITVANIASSNALITAIFKVDILNTMPVDSLAESPNATPEQKQHALVLAGFASMMKSKGEDLQTVITEIKGSLGTDQKMATPAALQFQAAMSDFAGSAGNKTGITDISTTPLVNIGGSTRTLTISVQGATAPISGIDLVVSLPSGVTIKDANNGAIQSTTLQSNIFVAGLYTHPTATTLGRVRLDAVSVAGFVAGDVVSIQCDIAPGVTPLDSDFILLLLDAIDSQSNHLTGLSLSAKLGN
jgi:hypothetical protein